VITTVKRNTTAFISIRLIRVCSSECQEIILATGRRPCRYDMAPKQPVIRSHEDIVNHSNRTLTFSRITLMAQALRRQFRLSRSRS
jgi:hypothetical protein